LIVARLIEPESIDTYGLNREGESLEIGRDRRFLAQLPVSAVLQTNVVTATEGMTLPEVLRMAGQLNQTTLPVLKESGALSGLIVIRDLLEIVGDTLELRPFVNAIDLARRNPPCLQPESNLDQAVQTMEYEGLDELPVEADATDRKFLGLVTRREVAASLSRMHLSLAILSERDDNISWATGYRVSRFRVPPWGVGKTLRDLDLRARFGVSVLAVGRVDGDQGFEPPSIERAFKAGDVMVVAGTSSALRRFGRATLPI
jgi:CBS domain-containing protein